MDRQLPKFWVYMAGPYSGDPIRNTRTACQMYESLRSAMPNALIICPHWSMTQHTICGDQPHEYWMQHDLDLIMVMHASGVPGVIHRMPGESKGANIECALAGEIGVPVSMTRYHTIIEYQKHIEASNVS